MYNYTLVIKRAFTRTFSSAYTHPHLHTNTRQNTLLYVFVRVHIYLYTHLVLNLYSFTISLPRGMAILVLWMSLYDTLECFPPLPEHDAIQPVIPPFFWTMNYAKEKKAKKKGRARRRQILVDVPSDDEEYTE